MKQRVSVSDASGIGRLLNFFLLLILSQTPSLWAASHGNEIISGVETWTADQNPHWVNGTVTVEKGAKLVIQPGAVVYFVPDYRAGIVVRGSLSATGNSSNARIFLGTEESHKSFLANK